MPRLIGKIALTAGGALLAGALLTVAYIAGGTALLAFLLSAVFMVGGGVVPVREMFAPIGFAALAIFALSWWALASLGVSTFWLWKRKAPADPPPPKEI